jgi:hypothetical protein
MIVEPELRVADFAKAGADIISVHAEQSSTIHLHRYARSGGVTAVLQCESGSCSGRECCLWTDIIFGCSHRVILCAAIPHVVGFATLPSCTGTQWGLAASRVRVLQCQGMLFVDRYHHWMCMA